MEKKQELMQRGSDQKIDDEEGRRSSLNNPESISGSLKAKGSKKNDRLVGTPDYMAPEIIKGISFDNYSLDWWSLGVMMFEFLVGVPPFNETTREQIYENIVERKNSMGSSSNR